MSSLSQQILAGLSLSQIAKIMGVSRQRIQQICKAQGIDVSALRLERERKKVQEIKRLASQGLSIGEIANEMGLTYCQVRDRAAANSIKCKIKHGVKRMPRGGSRAGAGRKRSPKKKVAVTTRLSEDSVFWLRKQKNQAKALERAIHREAIAADSEGQCPICQKPFEDCEYFKSLEN